MKKPQSANILSAPLFYDALNEGFAVQQDSSRLHTVARLAVASLDNGIHESYLRNGPNGRPAYIAGFQLPWAKDVNVYSTYELGGGLPSQVGRLVGVAIFSRENLRTLGITDIEGQAVALTGALEAPIGTYPITTHEGLLVARQQIAEAAAEIFEGK